MSGHTDAVTTGQGAPDQAPLGEATGVDLARAVALTTRGEIVTERHPGWSNGYVARVELAAPGDRYDLCRTFVEARDRWTSLSRAGNGTLHYPTAALADGVYECDSVWRSLRNHRVWVELSGGRIVALYEDKASAKARLAEIARGDEVAS